MIGHERNTDNVLLTGDCKKTTTANQIKGGRGLPMEDTLGLSN